MSRRPLYPTRRIQISRPCHKYQHYFGERIFAYNRTGGFAYSTMPARRENHMHNLAVTQFSWRVSL